jgi:ABC-type nitrate/sulfonate/bicarbonate transport system permease component
VTRARSFALGAAGLGAAAALWELAGRRLGDGLLAPPSRVAPDLLAFLADPSVLAGVASSLWPMLVGFALTCAIGLPLGVVMGRSDTLYRVLHPWVSTFVVTSVAAVVPILILIAGTGFWFQVAVVIVSSVWYVTLITLAGAKRIDRRWLDVGRSFGAGRTRSFFCIMLPSLLPHMLAGARIGMIHSVRSMVLAQLFVVTGIGGMLHHAGMEVSTGRLLSVLLTIMVIGLIGNRGLKLVASIAAPWHEHIRGGDIRS